LEFLDIKRNTALYEKDLESALISHLQEFLLELGNGFSFVARQKRLLLAHNHTRRHWIVANVRQLLRPCRKIAR
jgi:predicted nuclease of restriction endonuclease-like (RecB) superfamily